MRIYRWNNAKISPGQLLFAPCADEEKDTAAAIRQSALGWPRSKCVSTCYDGKVSWTSGPFCLSFLKTRGADRLLSVYWVG